MRTLTIKNPWAGLIAEGRKTIELRSWQTRYRGDVVICAGRAFDQSGAVWGPRGLAGHALCVVSLVDVRPATIEDADAACQTTEWDPSKWFAWVLSDVRVIVPIPVKGALGLRHWDLPVIFT